METEIKKPIPPESLWDGINQTDELWDFIEKYHPDYNCTKITRLDDVAKVRSKDYDINDPDSIYYIKELLDYTPEELDTYEKELMDEVFNDAYENYLSEMKETPSKHYMITATIICNGSLEVDAKDEEEAIEKAWNMINEFNYSGSIENALQNDPHNTFSFGELTVDYAERYDENQCSIANEAYKKYLEKFKREPQYAHCKIASKKTDEHSWVYFKINGEKPIKEDKRVFQYIKDTKEFLKLLSDDTNDYTVVKFNNFFEEIQE